jgi:hypothetical protein
MHTLYRNLGGWGWGVCQVETSWASHSLNKSLSVKYKLHCIICIFCFQTVIDVDCEVPKAYLCPLTKKLFTDPVITPYGHTYEREALMEYMVQNGPKDPIAQQTLDPSRQLTPNSALKSIIQNFKQVSKELS